jgi:DNA-binding beta-propeller fold protein YncE
MRNLWNGKTPGVAVLGLVLAAGGCSSPGAASGDPGGYTDASVSLSDAAPSVQCFSSNECPTGYVCSEFGTCEAPPGDAGVQPPPPEVERELGQPSSTLRFLYVAMPELDQVAKIDGQSLGITAIDVGDRPGLVAAVPGRDDAVVLDRGIEAATIVRPTSTSDEKITLATLPRLNAVDIDRTGRFAVAWFDLTRAVSEAGGLGNVGEIGSFQDVTVVAIARGEEKTVDLSVGFRPRKVAFDANGTHAYVITDDGVSVIDLAAAAAGTLHVAATIPVAADPLGDPALREVEITADGAWAVEREAGLAELRLVAIGSGAGEPAGTLHVIPLPAEATDVDLSADGKHAWAVLRDASLLAIVDVPGDGVDPAGVELVDLGGARVGSVEVDEAHGRALLFTNAFYEEELVSVDLAAPAHPFTVLPLQKGVRQVALAPDGKTALVLHTRLQGDPQQATSVEEFVDRSFGYSLVDLTSGFAKVALTPVDPGGFAFAPDGATAYLGLDGGDGENAVRRLQVMNLRTFVVRDVQLGSPPEIVGVLPGAGQAFVSQRHPLGRVTFVSFEDATTHTVTGFELGSQIVD